MKPDKVCEKGSSSGRGAVARYNEAVSPNCSLWADPKSADMQKELMLDAKKLTSEGRRVEKGKMSV